MSELFIAVCSVAPTRRRRFLWAAWWTGAPAREPFRKPDAFQGGARTREAALAEAERAAGVRLVEIEPRWARAWLRMLVGQPPWLAKDPTQKTPEATSHAGRGHYTATARTGEAPRASVWAILGVTPPVSLAEVKPARSGRAPPSKPADRGGTAEAFRELQRAYEEAQRRLARPRKQTPNTRADGRKKP